MHRRYGIIKKSFSGLRTNISFGSLRKRSQKARFNPYTKCLASNMSLLSIITWQRSIRQREETCTSYIRANTFLQLFLATYTARNTFLILVNTWHILKITMDFEKNRKKFIGNLKKWKRKASNGKLGTIIIIIHNANKSKRKTRNRSEKSLQ